MGAMLFGCSFVVLGVTRSIIVSIVIQVVSACGFSMIIGADRALIYENANMRVKNDAEADIVVLFVTESPHSDALLGKPVRLEKIDNSKYTGKNKNGAPLTRSL
jgi:hypothetical protein